MTKRRYGDEFRTNAVLMLEAAGYPGRKGSLEHVSKHLGVPRSTMTGWYNGTRNPVPSDMRREKKATLLEDLLELLGLTVIAAKNTVDEANFREQVTGIGILVDKIQLLTGQPTWRGEIIDLLKSGTVTPDMVKDELGDELANELFIAAGVARS